MNIRQGKTIVLLGASFATGNLGVSALAWSSVYLLDRRWPNADIVILGSGRERSQIEVVMNNRRRVIECWPIRYSPNVLTENHIVCIIFASHAMRYFPGLFQVLRRRNGVLDVLSRADAFFDITGGDSFSDIYGIKRFIRGYLLKRVCQSKSRPYVMLPQTYGPFKLLATRILARKLIEETSTLLCRDSESLEYIEGLFPVTKNKTCEVSPDVAFVLAADAVDDAVSKAIDDCKSKGRICIGINISGLLFYYGYTGKNEFELVANYRELMGEVVSQFASMDSAKVFLFPHVIPIDSSGNTESDLIASQTLIASLDKGLGGNVKLIHGNYDQCSIKYLIGKCDFFMGSRMHSTIASLSQLIPSIGLAYSKKFAGVYRTIDMEDCVLDLRRMHKKEILEAIMNLYQKREELKQRLQISIPTAKQRVMMILDHFEI